MRKPHREILKGLKKLSGHGTKHQREFWYTGNRHFSYNIKNGLRRQVIKNFLKRHEGISQKEFTSLLNSLYKGKSHEEKSCAGMLLKYSKKHRQSVKPELLDNWLNYLDGWAEVDSLCQSNFTADEMLANWKNWQKMLIKFSKDKNRCKRRASLVLLTKPVSDSGNQILFETAIQNIDRLKNEKDVLITKAISWLLRSMIKNHKKKTAKYIKENEKTLPKIAVRETKRKLLTGRK